MGSRGAFTSSGSKRGEPWTVPHSENSQDREGERQMEGKAVCMAPVTTGGFWKAFQDFRAT